MTKVAIVILSLSMLFTNGCENSCSAMPQQTETVRLPPKGGGDITAQDHFVAQCLAASFTTRYGSIDNVADGANRESIDGAIAAWNYYNSNYRK